ncbi:eCIS core domain-containing protein [Pseudoalteromonas sp. T1lg23B]|uniref:eCIS core domain-containing protein n=1 Tax=Pseudoalteromonas sp. T1lg23B TaxID=2077097 RepID=UPI000CF5F317|nr:DUF4157 domain-containing protein [Pseudoalteromonas sp. T1lg23B]
MSDSKQQYQRKEQASTQQAAQLKGANALADNRPASVQQQKRNSTGLPDNLKSGMESLSGMSLDHVKVHYNSSKPAMVQAHAYAQGSEIHLAPGQSHHLPHELGHVVQQAQGRVKPTTQVNGMNVNDSPSLEHEATMMGNKALQRASIGTSQSPQSATVQAQSLRKNNTAQFQPMEGMDGINYAVMSQDSYQLWQKSKQGTAQLHGKCVDGNNVVVTQYQDKSLGVQQQVGLSAKSKGMLLILEGGLTMAAGFLVIGASHGVLSVPGIISVCVGGSKIIRGLISMFATKDGKWGKFFLILSDALRTLEAAAAITSAVFSGSPAAYLFGIAKAIRSVCTAVGDFVASDPARKARHPKILSTMKKASAVAHWIEVHAGVFTGFTTMAGGSSTNVLTGGLGLATSASKGVRAKDQTDGAFG